MRALFILALCSALTGFAVDAERVIAIRDGNLAPVTELLKRGYTVKHQSIAAYGYGFDYRERLGNEQVREVIFLFTLSAPKGDALDAEVEREKAEEAQRQDAWRKRVEQQRGKAK